MTNVLQEWALRHGVNAFAMAELSRLFDPSVETPNANGGRSAVQASLRLLSSQMGYSLWRNNAGAMEDKTGRQVRFGLGNVSPKIWSVWKSSDLIGIGPGGKFVAVEVKAPGWNGPTNEREIAQRNFLGTVESLGGIGLFATSVEDYRKRVNA